MAAEAAFPPEESGTGSRPTPLVATPAWLKARSEPDGERASLTPSDHAFLESPPTYDEGGSLLPSLPPPPLPAPSGLRRAGSLLLFVTIAGSASAVLALAVLRYLGHSVLGL